jgi:cytochrome b pre-mRNA-processing protein 3
VPDTVDGRLDMILLHLVLVLRRLTEAHGALPPAGQRLFDRFLRDMDDNFREMGVGDLAVPKRMQKVGEAYYGRSKAYETGLANEDPAVLAAAVARNVFGAPEPSLGARRLATYMRETATRLDRQNPDCVVAAAFEFPDAKSVTVESMKT